MSQMEEFLKQRQETRAARKEHSLKNESPIPAGDPSALAKMIQGFVREKIIAPTALKNYDTEEEARRARHVKEWILGLYNSIHAEKEYSSWSHAKFEELVLKAFDKGFRYFVQVELVKDDKKLRKDQKVSTGLPGSRRTVLRKDPRTTEELLKDAYSAQERNPIQKYAAEKLSIFGTEFFHMLKACLDRKLPKEDIEHMLVHIYSIGTDIFEYEKKIPSPFELTSQDIAKICRLYPAQALKRLEAYKTLGPSLISKYWGDPRPTNQTTGNREWVASTSLLKHFVITYPDTVEKGLEIVDSKLNEIQERHPEIPKDIIIDTCAKFAGNYETGLEGIHHAVETIIAEHPCTSTLCDSDAEKNGAKLFDYLQTKPRLYQLCARRGAAATKIIQSAIATFTQVLEQADKKKIEFSFQSKRRIMNLLLGQTGGKNISRIIKREEDRSEREKRMLDKVFARAERLEPIWGTQYLIWGAGETFDEKTQSGQERIGILREYLGDNYVETLVEKQFDTLGKYITAGFPPKGLEMDRLKECLLWSPSAVRKYFEELNTSETLAWPKKDGVDVPEVSYDDSWQYESGHDGAA